MMFTYLKRRFSSGDLQGEMDEQGNPTNAAVLHGGQQTQQQGAHPQNENATSGFFSFAKEVVTGGAPAANPPSSATTQSAYASPRSGGATSGVMSQHSASHSATRNAPSAPAYVPNSTSASSGFGSSTSSGIPATAAAGFRSPSSSQHEAVSEGGTHIPTGQHPQEAVYEPTGPTRNPSGTVTGSGGTTGGGSKPGSSGAQRVFPSAPTSPTRSSGGSAGSVSSTFSGFTGHISSTIQRGILAATQNKPLFHRDKCKVLLVVDDAQTDWSKYFHGKKIMGEYDIRVEQGEFEQLSITAYHDQGGCTVEIHREKAGGKSTSFQPDFVLIRQPCANSTTQQEYRPIVSGFMYGRVPTLNALPTVYNMMDRPWVMAHLSLLRNRLGLENFPVIHQAYFPSSKNMSTFTHFPAVVKVGNAHHGMGKMKVESQSEMEDVASVVALNKTFATVEPLIDSKVDLYLQKIGTHYRAFLRKSISGHWKASRGSAMIEQVAMNERMRMWIDEASKLFGGLDICCVEVMQSRGGEYFIYKLTGSDMQLMGDTQEEDRRIIAEMTLQRMHHYFSTIAMKKTPSQFGLVGLNSAAPPSADSNSAAAAAPPLVSQRSHDQIVGPRYSADVNRTPTQGGSTHRSTSASLYQGSSSATASTTGVSRPPAGVPPTSTSSGATPPARPAAGPAPSMQQPGTKGASQQSSKSSSVSVEDGEDTMRNLRKTFAGIFGDM